MTTAILKSKLPQITFIRGKEEAKKLCKRLEKDVKLGKCIKFGSAEIDL